MRQRHLFCIPENTIDFSSNDYLGCSKSADLLQSIRQRIQSLAPKNHLFGATGSRLLTGNSHYTEELEARIAAFHGFEESLLFSCGYMANLAALSALHPEGGVVLYDESIHASTKESIRLSGRQSFPVRHNDSEHLEKRLKSLASNGPIWICLESIYSTSGSLAPLEIIFNLAAKYQANLIIDEAHACGIYGPLGQGRVKGCDSRLFCAIATYGKAFGVHGAAILCSREQKQHLIQKSRQVIYTTAPPLAQQIAIEESYNIIKKAEVQRAALKKHIATAQKLFIKTDIQSHIFFIPLQKTEHAEKIRKAGFSCSFLRTPTVSRRREGIRISLHSYNNDEELFALKQCLDNLGIIS